MVIPNFGIAMHVFWRIDDVRSRKGTRKLLLYVSLVRIWTCGANGLWFLIDS